MRSNFRNLSIAPLMCLAVHSAAGQTQGPAPINPSVQTNAPALPVASGPVYIYPLEVSLLHSLDSSALKAGDRVPAKLTHVWSDGECMLASGTAVSGEVVGVHEWTKQDKQTRVTLQFRYTCHDDAHLLRLITLMAPEYPDLLGIHGNPVQMQAMRSSLNGEGNPLKSAGNTIQNHVDMSGQQNPQWPLFVSSEPSTDHRPTEVKRGMVWRLPGIGLSVSEGAPPITSITSSHHSFKLPSETVFVMQPDLEQPVPVTTSPAPKVLISRVRLAPLPPEITACPVASCSDVRSTSIALVQPEQEFSLKRYGSLRGQSSEIAGLEYSSAVAFLGQDEVVICVSKPGLVQRTGKERPEDHPHLVQAVLYNSHSGRVERTSEWVVPNRERYLWPLADGRILVHNSDRLVWYGPGLTPDHSLPLNAPLAFVHTTEDGRHLLVGTIRELHTKADHAELYRNDNRAPEEEVIETVYDDQLHAVSEHRESSRAMAPLIWNGGRLSLRHRSNNVWYYRETLWNGEERSFGTLTSSCVPQTTVLSGDRILVVGCEASGLNAWARILRPDGSSVLHTVVHPNDLYPMVPAISTQAIVLVSPRINPSVNRDGALHASDITGESIRVLRSTDGHLEFATEVRQPLTSAQAAALSADGATLAVLDGDAVRFYSLKSGEAPATDGPASK